MCLSVPMQVVALEADGDLAIVERHGRRERVNMLLVGRQPLGTWVLVSLGFAKEVVEADALALIEDALAALAASLDDDYAPQAYFRDLQRSRGGGMTALESERDEERREDAIQPGTGDDAASRFGTERWMTASPAPGRGGR